MYVCLCNGITSQVVAAVVADGARTSNQVAAACGAGRDCARCRRTVQAIIVAESVTVRAADADCDCAQPDDDVTTQTPHPG